MDNTIDNIRRFTNPLRTVFVDSDNRDSRGYLRTLYSGAESVFRVDQLVTMEDMAGNTKPGRVAEIRGDILLIDTRWL